MIHPAVLTDRGLAAAVEGLASRAPVPVEIAFAPPDSLPDAAATAVYFVVSEALTNVAKYARAEHATVAVRRLADKVVVEVSDDGVGGADVAGGQAYAACRTASPPSTGASKSAVPSARAPRCVQRSLSRSPVRIAAPAPPDSWALGAGLKRWNPAFSFCEATAAALRCSSWNRGPEEHR